MSEIRQELIVFEQIRSANLYTELILQINKDVILAGLSSSFSNNISPKSLVEELSVFIRSLVNNQFSDYLNLLYRIDISESDIKKLDGSNIDKMSDQVALLILRRECQKVLLKNKL